MKKKHCDLCNAEIGGDADREVTVEFQLTSKDGYILRGDLIPQTGQGGRMDICGDCVKKHFFDGKPTWSFPLIELVKKMRGFS